MMASARIQDNIDWLACCVDVQAQSPRISDVALVEDYCLG